MDTDNIREHIRKTIHQRLEEAGERRSEALNEFMGVTMPVVDAKSAQQVASMVPELPKSIYDKWIDMFIERLLETVPENQLTILCDGTEENDAALALVYVMFMESERMERQIEKDLTAFGIQQSAHDDVGNVLAGYLRAKLATMKNEANGPMQ